MITFNDAIKDKTQTTDEKIIEYGQTVNVWLSGELKKLATNHRDDFINGLERINDVINGDAVDNDIFNDRLLILQNEDYKVEYVKSSIYLVIQLYTVLPEDIFQLFKIGEYVNFPLFKAQFNRLAFVVNNEAGDVMIDTRFFFSVIAKHDENRVKIKVLEV